MSQTKSVLVLGATGMLGNAMVRVLAEDSGLSVVAAARSADAVRRFAPDIGARFVGGLDAESPDRLAALIAEVQPQVVVNCIGLIKQLASGQEVLAAVPINSLLPHRLATLCALADARLIHISTDCVFTGEKGDYRESDRPDATDVYGLSKYLGEVRGQNAITLRTSIIGRELGSRNGLVEWFLGESGSVKGFAKAIFSGFPTVELARIVRDLVLPRPDLHGLYHVSAEPITKLDLLRLVAKAYGKEIEIVPDETLVIDRSLNSDRFRAAVNYTPPAWPALVAAMRDSG